jgi:hypothetical protein
MAYMCALAAGSSVNTRVGNELGAGVCVPSSSTSSDATPGMMTPPPPHTHTHTYLWLVAL